MPKGAFNSSFDPVVRAGGLVNLNSIDSDAYYLVQNVNTLPRITLEENFVVADGAQDKRELDVLEVEDGYFAQYRLLRLADELPADVEIRVDHGGKQSPMFETKNVLGQFDRETGAVYTDDGSGGSVVDHHMSRFTELFVFEDNGPYFTVENNSGGQVDFNLTFTGYNYVIEEVDAQEAQSRGLQPVSVPVAALDK